MSTVPDGAIGSDVWPGLAKLIEECGELLQVAGKILAYPEGDWHPDGAGDLAARLESEMGDVMGAIRFVAKRSDRVRWAGIRDRSDEKFARFQGWHGHEQAKAGKGKKP